MRAPLPALDATEGPQDAPKVLRGHQIRIADGALNLSMAVDRFEDPGAVDRGAAVRRGTRWPGQRAIAASARYNTLEHLSDAQRAPSARLGFSMLRRECAQSHCGGLLNGNSPSPDLDCPRKSFTFFHFFDRASWLTLALDMLFWGVSETIEGTAR